ncbi:MAG: hypothetical protein RL508_206 [Actinomycetota bacterium]|jgi:prepilin-type N-terminal cleavage/methylation domain-containing protein
MPKTLSHRNDAGFSLIEMLITVVILGILTSIVFVAVGGATRNAAIKSCTTDWNTVNVASNGWINDNLTTTWSGSTDLYSNASGTLPQLGYMNPLPDPVTNNSPYRIKLSWDTSITPAKPVIGVYDKTGTTQLKNSTAASPTNTWDDCKGIQ